MIDTKQSMPDKKVCDGSTCVVQKSSESIFSKSNPDEQPWNTERVNLYCVLPLCSVEITIVQVNF